ncbi:BAH_G0052010.mRNA.1.CDS.1 [Saccharomyces cerevisiae]|nr:BAH_G0052010.mRNA.1.CDS.1 [Saccharomyces cerevisiae]CAI7341100.1 BAH_G0052010.mRNA.1.CDS.1 [Saccharomyces cerevisiae]
MSIHKRHARTVYRFLAVIRLLRLKLQQRMVSSERSSHLVPPPAFTKLLNLGRREQVRIMCNQSEGHRRAHDIVSRNF